MDKLKKIIDLINQASSPIAFVLAMWATLLALVINDRSVDRENAKQLKAATAELVQLRDLNAGIDAKMIELIKQQMKDREQWTESLKALRSQ